MTSLRLLALALLVASGACASRPGPVTAPAIPAHPEYVFPRATGALPQRLSDDHQAAWHLLQGGDLRSAERRYTSLLRGNNGFYPAHAGLGYVALSRKDYKEALSRFDRALAADPGYAAALAGKGQTYLAMGQRAQALESFDAALASDPSLTAIRSAADVLRVQGLQGDVAEARKAAAAGRVADARTAYLRALAASPQSPFLYRELAEVERRDGNLHAALGHAEKAVALEPSEPRALILLSQIHEAMGAFAKAADALAAAVALEPSDELNDRLDALRAKVWFESMPEEYRAIEQEPTITRAQLAALIGVRLDELVKRAPRRSAALVTDTRGSWAQPWILAVTRAGFMEVYSNYTFQPRATVRRGDLAFSASRILSVIALDKPGLAAGWRRAKRRFPDIPPGHLSSSAAAIAVEAGVIAPLENGAFGLTRPVSGREAIEAVSRLQELAGTRTR